MSGPDIFPTDDDRGALVYDCWMAGAKATKVANTRDNTALEQMFYHFGYDKTVREPHRPTLPNN